MVSVYGMLIGSVVGAVGVSKALLIGAGLLFCSRLALAVATTPAGLWVVLLVALPVGESLAVSVITTAIKRYCARNDRHVAYGIFYVTVNIGGFLTS